MKKESLEMPVLALRDMSILPGMVIHFDVNREITRKALEQAMEDDQKVFIVTQKNNAAETPDINDLYSIGTLATVKQIVKLPGDILRVLVVGEEKAELKEMRVSAPYLLGEVHICEDNTADTLSEQEKEAMLRGMKDILGAYIKENQALSTGIASQLEKIDDISKLLEQIAIQIPLTVKQKQNVLESVDIFEQYQCTAVTLTNELGILRIKKEYQTKIKAEIDKNQKEYILREQLKVIKEELGDNESGEMDEFMQKLGALNASEEVKAKIRKEITRFATISSNSSESAVSRNYIETLLSIPWDKEKKENNNIKNAESILNEDHYGLLKVKERILEYLAVRQLTEKKRFSEKGESTILCLVGPPGTGKTSIAKSLARALNKEYVRICLGGVRDEAEIRGHRRTYVGAMPGRMIHGMVQAGVSNPLILLDEIDKTSSDHKGDTSSALLEVLDSEQNSRFVDHYVEIPVDLSKVLFVATANDASTIPRPLLDRMELIEVSSYTEFEKFHIAKEHLIRKQYAKNGIKEKQLYITDKALRAMIGSYTREAGVRGLSRKIDEICRKTAIALVKDHKTTVKVNDKNIEKYLGKARYSREAANEQSDIGIVRGLAWTSVGGDTLQIEVNVMPGKGDFVLTGQMGDVMKESAKIGISYIRSISSQFHIDKSFYEKNSLHIHIPEGAVPKDGPSAGITMATALLSAISKRKVRADIAMTGEITLRGRVLPVGGLKEKILAAKNAGIKKVLVPEKNKKDIDEIEKEIRSGIEIQFVNTMESVLKEAFV